MSARCAVRVATIRQAPGVQGVGEDSPRVIVARESALIVIDGLTLPSGQCTRTSASLADPMPV